MKRVMLVNAVHKEQKRMVIVESGKLVEFNIQMSARDITVGNVYKGIVRKIEKGLQAAFVDYGAIKNGFLPIKDIPPVFFSTSSSGVTQLNVGQNIIVQVVRDPNEQKGALLTSYISLPGRYLVLMPNKASVGISRKIESDEDRKKLKSIMSQIKIQEGMGFIVRTAGLNRKKQELLRDYLNTFRLYKEIVKMGSRADAPALLHHESDFGVCTLRDYLTTEVEDIFVDDPETLKKMRDYCRIVAPKMVKNIKQYKDDAPIFDQSRLEEQIQEIYQDRVFLRSGGHIVISHTEAMITIDVNSGRGSSNKNVEETALKTNLSAAGEIARQLRLRDLGGLIVIDFIDMMDKNNIAEVEKTFLEALSIDRARIQTSKISKFGLLEISRQKKQPTIQEISYIHCP
ncbi:MAG: Rne/Rng family ribonuclease, partial [Deltaproteobacteria bacterium]